MKRLLPSLFMIALLASCSTPQFYQPQALYLQQSPMPMEQWQHRAEPNRNTHLMISRAEPIQDRVRLYVHLLNNDGQFIPSGGDFQRNRWCLVENTVNNRPHIITDFTVQEIDRSNEDLPTAYAMVLDHSGSMAARVRDMQDAVENFIRGKRPQDAISVVKYDDKARIEIPATTDRMFLQSQFQKNGLAGYGGLTAINNGIHEGILSIMNTPFSRKVVISFTDGGDNRSTISREYVIWMAQTHNIQVCTIDLGASVNQGFMQEIAQATGGTYNYMRFASEFPGVFQDIQNRLNHSYVIEYQTPGQGNHIVKLRLCLNSGNLEATGSFSNITRPVIAPIMQLPPRSQVPTSDGRPFKPAPNTQVTQPSSQPIASVGKPAPGMQPVRNNVKQVPGGQQANNNTIRTPQRPPQNPSQQSSSGSDGRRPLPTQSSPNQPQQSNTISNDGRRPSTSSNEPAQPQPPVTINEGRRPGTAPNQQGNGANAQPSVEGNRNPGGQGAQPANPGTATPAQPGTRPAPQRPHQQAPPATHAPAGGSRPANPSSNQMPALATPAPSLNNFKKGDKNSTFTLSIFFEDGTSDLIEVRSGASLDQLAQIMQQNPSWRARVEAHTDNSMGDAAATTLTNERAEIIRSQLVQRGVTASRITPVGMGASQPVADNNTEQGRRQNNRYLVRFN